MTTITDQDVVSIPRRVLSDFVAEFDKLRLFYELIDHTLAEKDIVNKRLKKFTNKKALFHDLDN